MADRYWRGGTGTWNTTNTANWSATSGGAGGASVPTTADNVFFNASSGSGTVTLTGALNALSLNFTGTTLTFVGSGSNTITYHGSFTMGSGATLGAALGSLESRGTVAGKTFTSAGKTLTWLNLNFYATGGSMTMSDALTTSGVINIGSTSSIVNFGNFTHTCGTFNLSAGTANFTSPGKVVISRSTNGTAFAMPTTTGSNASITTYNRFEVLSPPAGISISVAGGYRTETNAAKLYYIASGTGTISGHVPTGVSNTNGTAWSIEAGSGNYTIQGISAVRSVTISSGFTGTLTGNVGMFSTDATGCTLNFGAARTSNGYFYGLAVASGTNPLYLDSSLTMTADNSSTLSVLINGIFTLRNNSVLTVTGLSIEPTLLNSNINFGTGSEKIVISKTVSANVDAFRFSGYSLFAAGGLINRKPIEVTAPPSGQIYYIKLEEGISDQQKHFSIKTIPPSVGSAPFGTIQFSSLTGTGFTTGGTPYDLIMNDGDYGVQAAGGIYPNGMTVSGSITVGGSTVAPRAFAYQGITFVGQTNPQVLTSVGGALLYFYLTLTNTNAGAVTLGSNITLDATVASTGIQFGLSTFGSGQGYLALGSYTLTLGYIYAGVTTSGNVNINFGTGKIRLESTNSFTTQVLNLDTQYYGTISGSRIVEVAPYGTFAQNYIRWYDQRSTTDYAKSFTIRVVNNGSTGLVCHNGSAGSLILEDGPYAFNGGNTASPATVQIFQDLDILGSSINFLNTSSTFSINGGAAVSNFNTYGSALNIYITIADTTKTLRLSGAASIATLDLPAGIIDLNNYTLTLSAGFTTTGSNARTIAFGTGSMVLTRSTTGTAFNMANQTNLTLSGTSRSVVITTPSSSQTKTITTNSGWTDPVDYTTTVVGTGGTINFSSGNFRNLTIAGGTYTIGLPSSYTIYGDLTVNGAITAYSNGGTAQNFAKSSGTQFINTNGNTYGGTGPITFNVLATTLQLSGNSNFAASVFNHNQGTLALNDFRLTVPSFSSTSGSTRTINFGTSGAVRLTGSGTVWNTSNVTGLTISGTNRFVEPNLNGNQTLNFGALAAANTLDVSVPTTASNNTLSFTAGEGVRNLSFANVAYTVANVNQNIYGNLTVLGTTPVFTSGSNTWTFSTTGGSQTITSGGETFGFPIDFGGTGTLTLGDDLTITSGFTHTSGTLSLGTRILRVNSYTTSNSNVRTISFGAGSEIRLAGTGTVWNSSTNTNLTTTGTTKTIAPQLNASQTLNFGAISEANAFDISVPATAGNFTLSTTTSDRVRNLTFANATYTVSFSPITVVGSFTVAGTSPTFTSTASTVTFAATSGSHSITTNGEVLDFPININAPGATYSLGSALTLGSTRTFTLTQGTFNTSNFNVTSFSLSSSGSSARTLTLGSSIWTILGDGSTAWDITTSTNMTFNRGTSKISMSSASNKTFNGGGLTYGILEQAGAGTLTITGTSNRFADLQRSFAGANTITMPGSVTTFFDDFTLTGVSAVARTTLNSSGTSTISKSSGTVSVNFLSISSSNATGGASWYAGNNSVNGGGNTGWIFTAPPQASGNMLMVFM